MTLLNWKKDDWLSNSSMAACGVKFTDLIATAPLSDLSADARQASA